VEAAYEACRDLTSAYAKTFFLATLAMEPQQAKATWAIYAWCRRVDEIVDGPNVLCPPRMTHMYPPPHMTHMCACAGPNVDPDPLVQRRALEEWNARLESMHRGDTDKSGLDQFDIAFRDMLQRFAGSDVEPYRDMVRGMVMDIDQDIYQTWDDLYLYCYRVASTVGLMTLPVMGTAPGVTLEQAKALRDIYIYIYIYIYIRTLSTYQPTQPTQTTIYI
jgi:phytoene synthase